MIMNKLTHLILSAIFTILLSACDKPADQSLPSKTEEVSPQSEPHHSIETTKSDDTGAQDYKTLREWQNKQEEELGNAITNAINNLNKKQKSDPTMIQEAVNQTLLTQIEKIRTTAESLNIQNAEVKALQEKTIAVLILGAEMIAEGSKINKNPTPEAHKAFAELQIKLNQLAEEGQHLENSLKAKYELSPATE